MGRFAWVGWVGGCFRAEGGGEGGVTGREGFFLAEAKFSSAAQEVVQ